METTRRYLPFVVALGAFPTTVLSQTYASHFETWFPQFAKRLEDAKVLNCSNEYHSYLYDPPIPNHPDTIAAAFVNCILESDFVDEAAKANMSNASVLLGLLPLTLQQLGSTTFETAHVALRRPLFALLLSLGSLGLAPDQGWESKDPRITVQPTKQVDPKPRTDSKLSWRDGLLVVAEYLAVLIAVGNVLHLALQLGTQCFSSCAARETYLIFIWTALAMAIHLCACVALHLRVRVARPRSASGRDRLEYVKTGNFFRDTFASLRVHILNWPWEEFRLSRDQEPALLVLRKETRLYLFLTWFTAAVTVIYTIAGTLILSSLLFISVQDAVVVALRYIASALICRALVIFELDGIRQGATAVTSDQGTAEPTVDEALPLVLRKNTVVTHATSSRTLSQTAVDHDTA